MTRAISPPAGTSHVPILVWGRSAPEGALTQLEHIAAQPYVVGHVAAMPDLHVAHGVSVGTVFATASVIVPSALGGDLGCGVAALRFDLPARALAGQEWHGVRAGWAARIPVGDAVQRGKGAAVPEPLLAARLSTGSLE